MEKLPVSFTCMLIPFMLFVKPTADPNRFTVRVTKRLSTHPFQQALCISPGTVLELRSGTKKNPAARFVFVRAFRPKLQYRGRFVASGEIDVETC
jgi:hypothetical protein